MNSIDSDLARVERDIARANPVPPANLPSADSPPARQILGAVLAERSPSHRAIWLGVGTVTVAAITVVVVITQVLAGPSSGRPVKNPTAGADTFTTLAAAAARQPAVGPPGPGQYQYTGSVSRDTTLLQYKRAFYVTQLQTRQIWIATKGGGRIDTVTGDPRFVSPKDRAAWIADGRPRLPAKNTFDQRFGRNGLGFGPVNEWKLPTNVARLGSLLRRRAIEGGPPGPHEDFVQIGDLLRETDAPPALRAALFKVAASIRGVRVLGRVTDRLGRTGIVVAYVEHPPAGSKYRGLLGLDELIFAPGSSALLDEQSVLVNTRTHTRTVTTWTSYIASGVVGSVTAVAPPYGHTTAAIKPA